MEDLNEKENFSITHLYCQFGPRKLASEIIFHLMVRRKICFAFKWGRKDIYPKDKKVGISQLVTAKTILTPEVLFDKRKESISSRRILLNNKEGNMGGIGKIMKLYSAYVL